MNVIRLRWVAGLMMIAAGAAAATADSPEERLKARGLKRVGSTYILTSEGDVQKKASELRALYNQLGMAARRQAEAEQQVENQKGMMREMLQRRVALNEQITLFDQQLRNIGSPAPGNVYGIAERNELVSQRNVIVNEYNGLGDRIRQFQQGELADPKVQDQLLAEVSRRREGFMQGVLDLRQLVDAAAKSSAELAGDAAVKEALDALGRTSKAKPKLGPSSQFAANVKLLERIEKSVMTDSVDLRKQGGVFWVDATFNGKVVKPMVFDTGAGLTTIPARLAEEIGLKPSPSDPVVHCETADGTVVEARRMTIPSLRVGRFQVDAVDCAVMPASKGDVSPLLGQSFHRHFTYKFTPESGHLVMSRVEGLEPQATTKAARPSRGTAKAKSRAGRSRGASARAATGDGADANRPD
jgi:clan AA aspartic protease (TIGR02281 family)